MDTLLSVGLSHQDAMRRRMDVIANNIANASTTAYKSERIVFQDYLFNMEGKSPKNLRDVRMVLDYGILPDMKAGALQSTGNPLDIALEGEGFFVVEDDQGNRLYSRSGKLGKNDAGELVTQSGARVLGTNDQPIMLDPDEAQITISDDGTITTENGEVARIQMIGLASYQGLARRGDGLFATEQPELPPQNLRILQGMLEGSNVNTIQQITEMMTVLRAYQTMERSLSDYSDLRSSAIDRLARVQA